MIWLSTPGGRSLAFDPNQFEPQPAPNPVVTAFRVRAQAFSFDADSVAQFPARLNYSQNVLTFEFTAIDFEQGEGLNFEYRLDPFDRDWVQAGTNRAVTYTSLDGGNYTFRVRSINEWGLRSEREAVFKLHIRPPFYRTWWFFALCTIALGGLFFTILRYRELQRLEKEQIRQRIARDLHDDVGSTLSSISILSDAALSGTERESEKQRLGNIGEKARSALDSISDIGWAVNPQNDSMEKVTGHIIRFAVEMLEPAGIVVDVFTDKKANALKLPMEQRKEFYLIFKEAINNCGKHSKAKNARISLTCEEGKLQLEISDDGVGFDPEKQTSGNGMHNMRARANAINGQIEVRSAPGRGTAVVLSLPFAP
jgi:signal transduction histidine kinase